MKATALLMALRIKQDKYIWERVPTSLLDDVKEQYKKLGDDE